MKNLVKAVLQVMSECEGIDKGMTVGSGRNSYKGVSDKDVKLKVGKSMRKHGLIILPIDVKPIHEVSRWEEDSQYGLKQKQSVFTEVITKYLLIHESGEQVELAGYGHGVDSQDKAAGKATTYALKYVLLYSFLVATGHIDDSDNTHSDEVEAPKPKPKKEVSKWDSVKAKFIAAASKEKEAVINGGGIPTTKLAAFIQKALNEYGATGEQVITALKEAGIEEIKSDAL